MLLSMGDRRLDLSTPAVMGVVNLTPDSFSGDGIAGDHSVAVSRALEMISDGASIIDLGGESTRPGAAAVSGAEQLERILPVLERLRPQTEAVISIDSGDPQVIEAVAAAGADIVNDVYALRHDGALQAAAKSGLAVCLMHMQGEPASMQDDPRYDDVSSEVLRFLRERSEAAIDAGVSSSSIIVDPGFGFGKTDDHNLTLLADLGCFRELGLPILAGLSRKGTLGRLTGRPVGERLAASLAAAVLAVERGAAIIRAHDVAATVDALKVVNAAGKALVNLAAGPAG